MTPSNLKIVYMGTPGFAVSPLKMLKDSGYNVSAVVTAPDKPSGRGMQLTCSDVKKYCETAGLNILQPISLKEEDFISVLREINPDIIVVVAFRMLPKIVWSIPRLGTFNLHASLLPKYRGAAPINWAIINGEKETGVTTFMIDEEIDTGSIMFSEKCAILPEDNFESLHDKLMNLGSQLVLKTVDALSMGNINFTIQSSVEATMGDIPSAPKLNKENTKICWERNSEDICNFIRGLSPFPTAYTFIKNIVSEEVTLVKIYDSTYEVSSGTNTPGHIITDSKSFIKVECTSGQINIKSLQLPGKKRLNVRDFLAGFRDIQNYKFI